MIQVIDWLVSVISTGKRMMHFCGRKQKAVSWKETESEKYGRRKGHTSITISLTGTWYQRKESVKTKQNWQERKYI